MAPPRTAKTSLTSNRQSRKRVVEEVEETEARDDTDVLDVDDEAGDEEPQESQDTSERLDQMMAKIVNDQRTRHKVDKHVVGKSYNTACTTLQTSINALFDDHEDKASSAYQVQVKRLKHLLDEKTRLEVAMADKLKQLQAGYDAHSRDLELVVNRRIKEMNHAEGI
ncbi:hypothetical protein P153DRAFT_392810 [Dothidotthia symphoricarpi CBS 119687]|uniref:Uncharacterized protein n=1 Tax=Dothidotthia symphoricarpi CBS 119687 TaxID=1392245 RepID=A0A6A6ATB3_9PLEO|nr:uncharacterized protein P153DRAFT_392810 [Dothidotthia symphoricarpi CBS 119687]KAF2134204.1 hypothetical protein P153DRAFT_392810 [Dothidotthia symphoricarpi CBS 119687]